MKYTYVPLPLVEEAKSVTASAQVLVIDDGEVKRTDASNIGIIPTGKINISENGTDIDVSQYATADVAVSGGSSDFSTAEVTVVYTVNDDYSFPLVYAADENELGEGSPKMIYNMAFLPAPDPPGYPVTLTFNAVLYDGIQCFSYDESLSASVSGDITENDGFYTITGAGTITLHD